MIESIRVYYKPKKEYQNSVLNSNLFYNMVCKYDYKSDFMDYPIKASIDGISIFIDEYKSFISIHLKTFHNSLDDTKKLSSIQNISFTQIMNLLEKVEPYLLNVYKTKISQIQLQLSIPTEVSAKSIIENNILMFKYHYYNHNKRKNNNGKKILKEFEFTNFSFIFRAFKEGDKANYLSIFFKMNKSAEFKELDIKHIHDLVEKEKLKKLFSILLKRYNQFIIVDNIDSYEIFEDNDKNLIQKFMTYGYWDNMSKTISKQALHNQKKNFEGLLSKYELLKLKNTFKSKLELAFEKFINN
jgi:hypothetical protein